MGKLRGLTIYSCMARHCTFAWADLPALPTLTIRCPYPSLPYDTQKWHCTLGLPSAYFMVVQRSSLAIIKRLWRGAWKQCYLIAMLQCHCHQLHVHAHNNGEEPHVWNLVNWLQKNSNNANAAIWLALTNFCWCPKTWQVLPFPHPLSPCTCAFLEKYGLVHMTMCCTHTI